MKKYITGLLLATALLSSGAAMSKSPTEVFANCLVDTLDGKERKSLAKWVFFAIAAHPEINSYSRASSDDIKDMDKYVGNLITRLLTEDCPEQLKTAYKTNPQALEQGFQLVGRVAMQELMADQNVMKALTNYGVYADQEKIGKVLGGK